MSLAECLNHRYLHLRYQIASITSRARHGWTHSDNYLSPCRARAPRQPRAQFRLVGSVNHIWPLDYPFFIYPYGLAELKPKHPLRPSEL